MAQDTNSGSSPVGQLAQLFEETGHAHHEAFAATGGVDPDWAIWYADHAVDRVNSLLGTELSRAELVYEVIGLSREQPVKAPDAAWPDYYASSLVDRLAQSA